MAIYSIYKFTNLVNGKVYIGKTINSVTDRVSRHYHDAKNGSYTLFHRALRKYGEENFKVEVIFNTFAEDDLNHYEKHFISEYSSYVHEGHGYNSTKGGEGFDSTTAKINAANRIKNGTHPWLGSENNLNRFKQGTHPFQGEQGSARARTMALEQVDNGVHPFQGERGRLRHKQLIENGTHHSLVEHVCPHCGKTGKSSAMLRWHFDQCKFKN